MRNSGNMFTPPEPKRGKLLEGPHTGIRTEPSETPRDFAVSGSPHNCNRHPGEAPRADIPESDAALSEYRGLGAAHRISSCKGGQKADIPHEGYKSPQNLSVD